MAVLCEGLAVSRRGFYAYVQRQAAPWRDHDAVALLAPTGAIHTQRRQSDGHRRMAKPLQADALPGGRYKARRLMPEAGVAVRHRKRYPVTTDSRHGDAVAPNLVARPCDVEKSETV